MRGAFLIPVLVVVAGVALALSDPRGTAVTYLGPAAVIATMITLYLLAGQRERNERSRQERVDRRRILKDVHAELTYVLNDIGNQSGRYNYGQTGEERKAFLNRHFRCDRCEGILKTQDAALLDECLQREISSVVGTVTEHGRRLREVTDIVLSKSTGRRLSKDLDCILKPHYEELNILEEGLRVSIPPILKMIEESMGHGN